jgi:glucose-1-phosphate thymidylyltransferase
MTSLKILIDDTLNNAGSLIPFRFYSFSEFRNGIFTPLERIKFQFPKSTIYYKHTNPVFQEAYLARNPDIKPLDEEIDIDHAYSASSFLPWDLLSKIGNQIREDINLIKEAKKWISKFKVKSKNYQLVGKEKHLWIHHSVKIGPGVVFDVTKGPILIEKDCKISPFTYIEGPCVIESSSQIDNARITGGCIIGTNCRIGGEVENSLIGNYTNKHHEGFLGHSMVGNWVNIGALATTSDLKNNYGIVKIKIGDQTVSTNTIKFGSIIGDFSKIGIGTMMNTGTTIDIGCNIVDSKISGYCKPFQWADGLSKYRLDSFLQDTKKIMGRRNQTLSIEMEKLIESIYEKN